jgi:hypothetical protein
MLRDPSNVDHVRSEIIRVSELLEALQMPANPMYHVGGTALIGDEQLPIVHPPFLPPLKDREYTLVLDLDETLVHYYELNEEGQYRTRPGCH